MSERKTIWLCGACGRTGETRMTVGDESCYLNSVEVFVDSIQRNLNGRTDQVRASRPRGRAQRLGGLTVAVEVRDVALEHYSASAVLVRFPSGEKVWLPLSQIDQMPSLWSIPSSMAVRRGAYLLITDWIAKQKGFKITPRELDIDPERANETPAAQTIKLEPLVNGKPFAVAALEQQVERLERDLRNLRGELNSTRSQINHAQSQHGLIRIDLRNAEAQRDKAIADLALAQDALRKANERADKAEAYIAAQGRADQNLPHDMFSLLELE